MLFRWASLVTRHRHPFGIIGIQPARRNSHQQDPRLRRHALNLEKVLLNPERDVSSEHAGSEIVGPDEEDGQVRPQCLGPVGASEAPEQALR